MTVVYLVRHSIAAPFSPEGDRGRALTDEGRSRFRGLVETLRPDLAVRRILCSPFARAVETARILGELVEAPVEESIDLASGQSAGAQLLALARSAGDGSALVGHNPEITDALILAAGHTVRMVPGTIAAIELAGEGTRLLWAREP